MGRPLSEATKEKIRQAKLGKKLSPETRAKMSEAHKGKTNPHGPTFSGQKHTAETRALISQSLTGRVVSEDTKTKMSAARAGVAKSAETRHRMSLHRQDTDHPANKARSEGISKSNAERSLEGADFHVKGHHVSCKATHSPVAYRSVSIELRLMEQLDADPTVVQWESPVVVPFRDSRGVLRYTLPDFLVTYEDGSQRVIEGKGPHLMPRYLKSEKFQAVRTWCAQHGLRFWVVTTGPHPDYTHHWQEIL